MIVVVVVVGGNNNALLLRYLGQFCQALQDNNVKLFYAIGGRFGATGSIITNGRIVVHAVSCIGRRATIARDG